MPCSLLFCFVVVPCLLVQHPGEFFGLGFFLLFVLQGVFEKLSRTAEWLRADAKRIDGI